MALKIQRWTKTLSFVFSHIGKLLPHTDFYVKDFFFLNIQGIGRKQAVIFSECE